MPQDSANPTDNLRIWRQVQTTDPSHTKPVEFGRKFTSIDAHWQIMRATETFGPVGQGWGYSVEHSTTTLAPEMVLAVADVSIWYREASADKVAQYGPVRGTCEMWSQARSKGKRLFEEDATTPKMITDEDAPKKAMTDALTKGLSHLGFSADVFLGMYDDNRYVQKLKREFANGGPKNGTGEPPESWTDEAKKDGLMGDETRSAYRVDKLKAARAAGWTVVNKTAKGQRDQISDYLDMAETPDDIASIMNHNAQVIANSGEKAQIEEHADKLLRWMESQNKSAAA